MTLREELALRLSAIETICHKRGMLRVDIWEELADEVIRQMEWARINGIRDMERAKAYNQRVWDQGGGRYQSVSLAEVTLAPPVQGIKVYIP
jgi:hypothetical protein